MEINIQNQNLFEDKLKKGIVIFAGAGFSVLKSKDGTKLPTAEELKNEIIQHFNLSSVEAGGDLSYVSEFCVESEYQMFLRERFTVKDYNPLYNALNSINLKAFATTNIDNIIRLVVDNGNRFYLKNIREYGACINDPNELAYIPLHGDIADINSKLYFGKFDLSLVNQDNSDLFSYLLSTLSTNTILFWGYSFNDSGVLSVIKDLIKKNHSNIWVQVLPDDNMSKNLFESKGCNIIQADTETLLKWISEKGIEKDLSPSENRLDSSLNKYKIPDMTKVATVPTHDYYQQGATEWYPIITGVPYERNCVVQAEDFALKYKNVIVSGCHFSGKTTILMQLAKKVDSRNKIYISDATKEKAQYILQKTNHTETWVFFDNCCSDIQAFLVFAKAKNIKLVGTADDYSLETVKHVLAANISYRIIDCSNIAHDEAANMYQSIPDGLRRSPFCYKKSPEEKFTMLEFISNNVERAYTNRHIKNILTKLKQNDLNVFLTVIAAAYFSQNSSAISCQTIANMLDLNIYPEAYNLINYAADYLRSFNFELSQDNNEIDYYVLRSRLLINCTRKVLIEDFKEDYAGLIKRMIFRVNPYSILRYDIFRRKAYDSELFHRLFSCEEATNLYEYLYKKDDNPYTLQQMALCQGLFGDYENAFKNIDRALALKPNNFSFKNSQAIILFEANHCNRAPNSVSYMKQALSILESCYENDKRKLYHAQKYAEFSIVMAEEFGIYDYLEKANDWLFQMTEDSVSDSYKTKSLKEKLSTLLTKLNS